MAARARLNEWPSALARRVRRSLCSHGRRPQRAPGVGWDVPGTFVVDREGRIAYKHIGPMTPKFIEGTLRPLLARLGK